MAQDINSTAYIYILYLFRERRKEGGKKGRKEGGKKEGRKERKGERTQRREIEGWIYIYIYIYAVKLLSGPSLATLRVIIWAKRGLLSGPSLFFSPLFIVVTGDLLQTQLSFCVFVGAQLSANFPKIAFFKKRCRNWGFSLSVF